MVPYVRKSFIKHYSDGLEFIGTDKGGYDEKSYSEKATTDLRIDDEYYKANPKVYRYAMKMLLREVKQAIEGLYHNLNSLQSRSGNQLFNGGWIKRNLYQNLGKIGES